MTLTVEYDMFVYSMRDKKSRDDGYGSNDLLTSLDVKSAAALHSVDIE